MSDQVIEVKVKKYRDRRTHEERIKDLQLKEIKHPVHKPYKRKPWVYKEDDDLQER